MLSAINTVKYSSHSYLGRTDKCGAFASAGARRREFCNAVGAVASPQCMPEQHRGSEALSQDVARLVRYDVLIICAT